MQQETNGFKFYQKVLYKNQNNKYHSFWAGIITGKLKDANCYVVRFKNENSNKTELILKFGLPVRHLELDWGHYKGTDTEFILPEEALVAA